jgi:hypothetical protein
LRTANLTKRRIVDRSQLRFEIEELRIAGGIILCRRYELSILFCSGLATLRKAIPRASPYQVGLWKTQAAKLDNRSDAVLRERGTARSWADEGKVALPSISSPQAGAEWLTDWLISLNTPNRPAGPHAQSLPVSPLYLCPTSVSAFYLWRSANKDRDERRSPIHRHV